MFMILVSSVVTSFHKFEKNYEWSKNCEQPVKLILVRKPLLGYCNQYYFPIQSSFDVIFCDTMDFAHLYKFQTWHL